MNTTNGSNGNGFAAVVPGGKRVKGAGDRVTMDENHSAPQEKVLIKAPNFHLIEVLIRGTSKYVMNNFGDEARNQMRADMAKGSVDKPKGGKQKRPPKDFDKGFRDSMHVSVEGWPGIPVTALRAALVRAAQLCGVEMTQAKMCVFVEADGYSQDGQGLVRITKGKAEKCEDFVRNKGGAPDVRTRAIVPAGWEATIRLRFDADFVSAASVVNLVQRAGIQVGVGAGRPFSTMSVGQGWGTFEIVNREDRS